jgi:hypothetical protein
MTPIVERQHDRFAAVVAEVPVDDRCKLRVEEMGPVVRRTSMQPPWQQWNNDVVPCLNRITLHKLDLSIYEACLYYARPQFVVKGIARLVAKKLHPSGVNCHGEYYISWTVEL